MTVKPTPDKSQQGDITQAPPTLLPLLSVLCNRLLAERTIEAKLFSFRATVDLLPTGLRANLMVESGGGLIKGNYPIEFKVISSSPEETVFSMQLIASGGIANVVRLGAKLLPRDFLNESLEKLLGDAVRLRDEEIILSHAGLLERLKNSGKDQKADGGKPSQAPPKQVT